MDTQTKIKIISFITSISFIHTSLFADPPPNNPPIKTITITQIVDHPSANAVREGVLAALKDKGYKDEETVKIIYENAQGNPVIASQIAQKFTALKPDLIIPITTPSTQAVVKADETYNIPVVFAAVTDPVASGVVPSMTHPRGHITGVTDAAPIQRQFDVFRQALPQLKIIGILYNPGDNSSATPVKEARAVAKEMGITLFEATAFKTGDVTTAMQQLVSNGVDAVFVPLDNTVLSAMDAVLKIAFQHNIPVFSSDSDSVAQGALISSGYTHFDTGYKAGEIAAQVLEGANPGDLPIESAQSLNIYVNKKSAQKLNIKFSDEISKIAKDM
jgi:putative ABC transport system substrate-binding protein